MSGISTYIIRDEFKQKNCITEITARSNLVDNIRVRIDENPHPKSERQLGYVWACIYPFLQGVYQRTTGNKYDIDTMLHPYHVELFLKEASDELNQQVDMGHGSVIVRVGMRNWKAGHMSSFIEWILRFYAVRGIYIPEANQYWNARGVRH